MAQINKKGMAEVKVKQMKEVDGKQVFTGEYEMVEVGKLTTDHLKLLKESQELQGKSMEELAIDQLSSLQSIDAKISATLTAMGFGAATTTLMQTGYEAITTGARKQAFEAPESKDGIVKEEFRESENVRVVLNSLGDKVSDLTDGISKLYEDAKKVESVDDAMELLKSTFDKLSKAGTNFSVDDLKKEIKDRSPELETLLTKNSASNKNNTAINTSNNAVSTNSVVNNATPSTTENKPAESKVDLKSNVQVNVTMDPNLRNQALSTFLSEELNKYYSDKTNMATLVANIHKYETENNLTPGGKNEPLPR